MVRWPRQGAPFAECTPCRRGALPPRLQGEPEEVLAHHLDVRRRHADVLGDDVHVTEAAFETAARVDRGRPGRGEHQVHGLGRARAADRRPSRLPVEEFARDDYLPHVLGEV